MKHHQIKLAIYVSVPDGVYLPDKFQLSQEERDEARKNGLDDDDAESAEREWAMFNIAKLAYEALGITVTYGAASSAGHKYEVGKTAENREAILRYLDGLVREEERRSES